MFLRIARLLVPLTCAAAGCGGASGPVVAAARDHLVVSRGTLARRLLLSGEIEAVTSAVLRVPLTSEFRVQITWIADDGSSVRAGDTVVAFDNTEFAGSLEERRLAVQRAERELERVRAEAETQTIRAESRVDRAKVMLDKAALDAAVPAHIVSDREHQNRQLAVERARAELDKATTDLEVARQAAAADIRVQLVELRRARRELELAESAIELLEIEAPRDGIFLAGSSPYEGGPLRPGEMVWTGYEVGSLPDLDRMRVRVLMPEVDDGSIASGMPVRCIADAYPDLVLPGAIESVGRVAQDLERGTERRFFDVAVALDDPAPPGIRPGMSVRVEVVLPEVVDVALVPRSALDLSNETPRVRVRGGGPRAVTLGACSAQLCVVVDGVEVGERLDPAGGPA